MICEVCVMDESCRPFVSFASDGCNHCLDAKKRLTSIEKRVGDLDSILDQIKSRSVGEYDCIIGVSGGLDSTYLVAKAVELGLKPLAVHMDNNWNSSMSSQNLRRVLGSLDVPLMTVVIDWEQQKQLQLAFLEADVVDVELQYDNCLLAVCYQTAQKLGIKTILGGANHSTEGVEVPKSWLWNKFDGKNIRAIAKTKSVNLKQYPLLTSYRWLFATLVRRIRWISLLDYLPYFSREEALEYLSQKFGYVSYGSKHFENVFTRFYQGVILPIKFDIDKRKPHLSSEIVTGKLSRDEAMRALDQALYTSEALRRLDQDYVLQKLELDSGAFEDYLARGSRSHTEFGYDRFLEEIFPKLLKIRHKLLGWIRKS